MLKLLFKKTVIKNSYKKLNFAHNDFKTALIAIFTRYGDGIIAFKITKEFAMQNPNKDFLVVTTHALLPYAQEFFGKNAIAVNKRNPFDLLRIIYTINKFNPDIGFNPWSFGDESKFFISLARNFVFFNEFKEWSKTDNLYNRAREYFNLPILSKHYEALTLPSNVKTIIFAPFSTDVTKTLNTKVIQKVLSKLVGIYPDAQIIICGLAKEITQIKWPHKFIFTRAAKTSYNFLTLLKGADLFVGVDAGPLHVAQAQGIFSIAIFGPTAPQTILDSYQNIIIWRNDKLNGTFCFVENCKNPICLDCEFAKPAILSNNIKLETKQCPLDLA